MQALQFDRTGTLDALKLMDLPVPLPSGEDVLVKVHASGINPSDIKNVLGRFPYTTLPRIPGRDFAGVVVQSSAAWKNQAVWGSGKGIGFTRDGSHAEYLLFPAKGLSLKPASLSFAQAAACGVPYLTAWEALKRGQVQNNTGLLIIGSGAVAHAAVALARASQARVVVALRNRMQQNLLEQQGIPTILLQEEMDFAASLRAHFPSGADMVFDTTGAWLSTAVTVLADFGFLAMIAAPTDGHVRFPALDFYRRGATLIGVNSLLHDLPACAAILDQLRKLFDAGQLAPPTHFQECPLADGVSVYNDINQGNTRKTVFVF
jgi:NADPH:quinone reductase-like Zn-dependent oxidoreductase